MCGCGGGGRPRFVFVGGTKVAEVKDFRLRPARTEAVQRIKSLRYGTAASYSNAGNMGPFSLFSMRRGKYW